MDRAGAARKAWNGTNSNEKELEVIYETRVGFMLPAAGVTPAPSIRREPRNRADALSLGGFLDLEYLAPSLFAYAEVSEDCVEDVFAVYFAGD